MKFALKSIVVAAAFVAAGAASAVTVTPGQTFMGLTASGSGQLSFGSELIVALDTAKMNMVETAPAVGQISKDADGYYIQAAVAAPITALTIDDLSHDVVAASTAGGANLSANYLKGVTIGGNLTVDNLRIDLTSRRVYADMTSNAYTTSGNTGAVNASQPANGAHGPNALNAAGATKLTNVYLWDVMGKAQYDADMAFLGYDSSTAIVGTTHISGAGTYVNELNGLKITAEGLTAFTKGFGLLKTGQDALKGVNDFGTITSTIVATAVPEPTTYALMGLGLVGLSLVARRKAK